MYTFKQQTRAQWYPDPLVMICDSG